MWNKLLLQILFENSQKLINEIYILFLPDFTLLNIWMKEKPNVKELLDLNSELKQKNSELNNVLSELQADIIKKDNLIHKLESSSQMMASDDMGDNNPTLEPYNELTKGSENTNRNIYRFYESLSNFLLCVRTDRSKGLIIMCINPEMIEFQGIGRNTIEGKVLQSVSFENSRLIPEMVERVISSGEPHEQMISPDGSDIDGFFLGFMQGNNEVIIFREAGSIEKLRQKELSLQGDVFERFADSLPEMIFEIDLNGKLTFANTKALAKLGLSRDDFDKGLTFKNIFKSRQIVDIAKKLKTLTSPDQSISNEYTAHHTDGSKMQISTLTYAVFNVNNEITHYRGILTDITERLQTKDELLKEKIFLETLIASAPESIVQTRVDGVIERINSEFTKVFGYTAEEAIGKNIDDLIIPEEIEKEGTEFTRRAVNNEIISTETIRKNKNGKRIYVSLLINPVNIDNETTALFAIYRDISDRKKDNDTKSVIYNISTAALLMTEFSDIFLIIRNEISKIWDTKNFYIVLYNSDNQTLSLPVFSDEKDEFEEIPVKGTLTGWLIKKQKAVLLKEPDIQILEDNNEISLVGTPCKLWLGVPLVVENETIGAMVLQDYNSLTALNNEDLRLLGLIGNQVALAIQRKRMLQNLINERRKAEEAGRLKQQFMSTMSHEIRTPLNEVIGISNLLLQAKPRDDQMEFIKTLRFSSNHLLTLVNDVLDYTKMESNMIVFEKTSFNISDFINDFKRSYSFRTDEKDLVFKTVISSNIPEILIGDPIRLNQILSNLLSNAIKFTKKGFIELGIREKSRENNSIELIFSVRDTGIGIPKEKHSSIFDRFTQASEDTTRKFGGTGLGLSICKKLVELQNGKLLIESEPGLGSKFSFNLHLLIAKEKERVGKETTREKQWNELSGKRILIAEDNKINFFVANKFLTKWGMIVNHAENGKIALELVENNEFDIVLMDLHMPEMDGIEATEVIRSSDNPEIKNIPIIALTAAILSEHEGRLEGLNLTDYILKPFKPNDLYDKILQYVR